MNELSKVSHALSAAQSEVWLAETLTPGTAQYNIAEYLEIHGPVDEALFEAALRQVVLEAESLNVTFVEDVDGPRQILDASVNWSLSVIDVSAESDPQAAAEGWMQADLARPVVPTCGPLFAYALFRAGSDRFFWYQRNHHIVMDAFGGGLIARRLAEIYTALVEGREPQPNPFRPFRDLLTADADYRDSEAFRRDRQHWLERLAGRPEPVSLAGRQAPVLGIRRRRTLLPDETTMALRERAGAAGSTFPQMLIALAVAYLHRMSGETDLVVGLPVTARAGRELRRIPGMISNVVPLRLTVGPEMALADLLGQVGGAVHRALRHQRYRSEDLRRDLELGTGRPLFATTINIMSFDYDIRFAGHAASARNVSNGLARDLDLYVCDRGPGQAIEIGFDANAALYSADDLASHEGRLTRLLEAAAADPARPIGSIDLLDPEERRRILVEWNDTAHPVPAAT
ncbi:MAG: non-ribosomal peptide synthetase, partial [Inquilinus limosus]|nr:non-ribosomal peptide synthetase [Inquilinus limosus]